MTCLGGQIPPRHPMSPKSCSEPPVLKHSPPDRPLQKNLLLRPSCLGSSTIKAVGSPGGQMVSETHRGRVLHPSPSLPPECPIPPGSLCEAEILAVAPSCSVSGSWGAVAGTPWSSGVPDSRQGTEAGGSPREPGGECGLGSPGAASRALGQSPHESPSFWPFAGVREVHTDPQDERLLCDLSLVLGFCFFPPRAGSVGRFSLVCTAWSSLSN